MTDEGIEISGQWRVVDRWWTDAPEERFFVVLSAPDGTRCAVKYDLTTKTWSVEEERSRNLGQKGES